MIRPSGCGVGTGDILTFVRSSGNWTSNVYGPNFTGAVRKTSSWNVTDICSTLRHITAVSPIKLTFSGSRDRGAKSAKLAEADKDVVHSETELSHSSAIFQHAPLLLY